MPKDEGPDVTNCEDPHCALCWVDIAEGEDLCYGCAHAEQPDPPDEISQEEEDRRAFIR